MMRLLYVSADPGVPVLGHKGASVHVRELVRALHGEGASVTLASPRIAPEGDRLDIDVDLNELAPVVACEHADGASLRAAMHRQAEELLHVAECFEPDAVYERHSLHSYAGAEVAEKLGLPYLLEVNAPLRDEACRFRTLSHAEVAEETEAYVYASADRIFAVSTGLRDLLVRSGVDAAKLEVMRNGVRAGEFPAQRRRGTSGFTVGFAGSLKPWHGVEVVVDAVNIAARQIESLRLEVVGDGPCADVLERLELPHGRSTFYRARPYEETVRIVSSWDVGLAPYIDVTPTFYFCPLKVIEYMAAGICPVASDLGDIRSLLGDGEYGFLVPPGDPRALAAVLVELAHDAQRRSTVAARAQRHARESMSWRRNARRVLECVQLDRSRTWDYAHA